VVAADSSISLTCLLYVEVRKPPYERVRRRRVCVRPLVHDEWEPLRAGLRCGESSRGDVHSSGPKTTARQRHTQRKRAWEVERVVGSVERIAQGSVVGTSQNVMWIVTCVDVFHVPCLNSLVRHRR